MKYTHEAMARSFSTLLDAHRQRETVAHHIDSVAFISGTGSRSND